MTTDEMEILTQIRGEVAEVRRRLDVLVEAKAVPKRPPRSLVESRPMAFEGFPKDTAAFLRDLEKHNEKAWFEKNRARYDACWAVPAPAFVQAVGKRLQKIAPAIRFEPKVNGSLFRIHRDTRFSKDKSPYKTHLDAWFWQGEDKGRDMPGFWFRITPKELGAGAGMHGMEKDVLVKYRKAVDDPKSGAALQKIVDKLRKAGLEVGTEAYKKVPKGFDPEHPRAELLRFASLFSAEVTPHPKELHSAALVDVVVERFKKVAPLQAWLAEALR